MALVLLGIVGLVVWTQFEEPNAPAAPASTPTAGTEPAVRRPAPKPAPVVTAAAAPKPVVKPPHAPISVTRRAAHANKRRPAAGLELSFQAPPAAPGPVPVKPKPATQTVQVSGVRTLGLLSKDSARATVTKLKTTLGRCAARAKLTQKVTLRLTVRPSGGVMRMQASGGGAAGQSLLDCARAKMSAARFVTFQGGAFETVSFSVAPRKTR